MQFPYTTFGIPLKGTSYAECTSIATLVECIKRLDNAPYIFGGGSNILPVGYINAPIVRPLISGIDYEQEAADGFVTVGSGVNWHELVLDTIDKGYYGLENLSLIPGLVGAAPIQNIGAYGVEISERIVEVECLDLHSLEVFTLSNDECDFAYRSSIFKQEMNGRVIITGIVLKLDRTYQANISYKALANKISVSSDQPSAKEVSNAVIEIRQSKLPDPKEIGNAGSFFKNPVVSKDQFESLKKEFPAIAAFPHEDNIKLAAGWMIEHCGLKGYQHKNSDAGVHDKQALVLVNRGSATGEDILATAVHVQRSVLNSFGVLLQPEVQIVGDREKIEFSGLLFE